LQKVQIGFFILFAPPGQGLVKISQNGPELMHCLVRIRSVNRVIAPEHFTRAV
jgi:hypothetical protein